jgi:small subunit ribosomal protein S3
VKLAPIAAAAKPAGPRLPAAEMQHEPARKPRHEAEGYDGGEGEDAREDARKDDPAQEDRGDRGGSGLSGQKVHPGGLRVGIIHDWKSHWYTSTKEFPGALAEDVKIRAHINRKLSHAGLSDILIQKDKQRVTIDIYTARPGIVIGKSGSEVDALRKEIHGMTQKSVHININEIKRPELDAKLVAQSVAEQLQNRVSFRRAMKRSLASAIRSGAQGVKISCAGRLGGGEMSRRETYSEGRVPLHTLRADIDYGFAEAKTTFGRIGVKVWINKGEIAPRALGVAERRRPDRAPPAAEPPGASAVAADRAPAARRPSTVKRPPPVQASRWRRWSGGGRRGGAGAAAAARPRDASGGGRPAPGKRLGPGDGPPLPSPAARRLPDGDADSPADAGRETGPAHAAAREGRSTASSIAAAGKFLEGQQRCSSATTGSSP